MESEYNDSCPYCGGKVLLKSSKIVYQKDYGPIYICENYPKCDSFVGCHPNTTIPLGTLANEELRQLRKECHRLFDLSWKSGKMKRRDAYIWLQQVMDMSSEDAHIGKFSKESCIKLLGKLKR